MDFEVLFNIVLGAVPALKIVLEILGALVIVGFTIVKLSPTKEDDAKVDALLAKPIIGPLLSALIKFSPIQRK